MILYRPQAVKPPLAIPRELREGELQTPEEAAAGAAVMNPWNLILEQEAAAGRRVSESIATARRTSTTTTPGGMTVLPATPPEPFHRPFNVAVVGDNIVVAGVPGYRICIHQLELYNTVAQTIRFLDGTTDLQGPLVNFPAQAGLNLRWQDEPHFRLSYGQSFIFNLTAGQVTGFLKYRMQS